MPSSEAPAVLCTGIAVQDIVFRVQDFPAPGGKCMTHEFMTVLGGCAVNAAVAVARLGGRARYAGPLGSSSDNVSNQLIAGMVQEGIDISGVVRVETVHNDFDFSKRFFSGEFLWHDSVEAAEYGKDVPPRHRTWSAGRSLAMFLAMRQKSLAP